MQELWHLVSDVGHLSENDVVLLVLGLVDVVMIADLLIMVIIGGYETFVIHLTFVVSAVALAAIDRFLSPKSTADLATERARVEASGP